MEISNNNVIGDLLSNSNVKLEVNFNGRYLELKVFLEKEENISSFLKSKDTLKERVNKIRSQFGFRKIWLRIYFGKETNIEDDKIKSLIDLQFGIFDEVTVQKVGRNIEQFKKFLEYAINKYNGKVSVILDAKEREQELLETLNLLDDLTPLNMRFLYGKFSTHLQNYLLITGKMRVLKLPYYLVACQKRCGIKDTGNKEATNVAISVIAKNKLFGFSGCCQDYIPAEKRNNNHKGFATHTDIFNPNTGIWEKHKVRKNFKGIRLENHLALDSIGNLEEEEAVKAVLTYLSELKK